MASSGSEDEKILQDKEKLEKLEQEAIALRSQLERLERGKQMLKERIERRSAVPEKPNQAKRLAIHLSPTLSTESGPTAVGTRKPNLTSAPSEPPSFAYTTPPVIPQLPALGRSQSQSQSRPQRQSSTPKYRRASTSVATAYTSDAITEVPSEGSSTDGFDTFVNSPPRRQAYAALTGSRNDQGRHHPKLPSLVTTNINRASQTPSSTTRRPISISLSSLPSSASEAQFILERINEVQGFQHFLNKQLIQNHDTFLKPDTLPATAIEWPALLSTTEFVTLLQQSTRRHGTECIRLSTESFSLLGSPTPKTPTHSRVCHACSAMDRIIYSISSFIGAAYLRGYPMEGLRGIWETKSGLDWVSQYVRSKDQELVRAGARLVLQCMETEPALR